MATGAACYTLYHEVVTYDTGLGSGEFAIQTNPLYSTRFLIFELSTQRCEPFGDFSNITHLAQ